MQEVLVRQIRQGNGTGARHSGTSYSSTKLSGMSEEGVGSGRNYTAKLYGVQEVRCMSGSRMLATSWQLGRSRPGNCMQVRAPGDGRQAEGIGKNNEPWICDLTREW